MTDILIINHSTKNCGVYQFGKRVADLALRTNLNIEYKEIQGLEEYTNLLNTLQPKLLLANWYPITMGWLSDSLLRNDVKNYFLFHDGHIRVKYDKYVFNGEYEKPDSVRIAENKKLLLPRPLLDYQKELPENDVINIGSFGFGFWHKGFHDVVTKVNEEFENAIINLHIPNAHFGDATGSIAKSVIEECIKRNKNPNIKLNITSGIKTDDQLLDFLAQNDVNCFFYQANNEGLSSVIDYALSVKRPIAVTDNMMFRHIISDNIDISKHSLKEIVGGGTSPLEQYYEKWSTNKFVEEFEMIFREELNAIQ